MEMPGRRSNYSLLSQYPDDQLSVGTTSFYESQSGDGKNNNNNKSKHDRAFDWDTSSGGADHKLSQQSNRIGNLYTTSIGGLQRQSSGSSFGESSLSGDYFVQNLSGPAANEIDSFGDVFKIGGGDFKTKQSAPVTDGSSSGKSWAQQTEESYQLQLALALRLSSEATCADDPNFLDPVPDESALRSGPASSPEAISHRFWVNGCLSYFDKVPDGFYLIHGVNPYVWTVCTDMNENGRIPSIESLRSVDPSSDSLIEVVLIDRRSDPSLKELQNRVVNISCTCITTQEVVDQLAKLVCNRMGGSATAGEDDFVPIWRECSDDIKDCLGSVVVPIGSLSIGLCRHRTLLFKVLADAIDLPCRIAKGCKYCKREDASSCLVRFGLDREYLVDLIGKPGHLCDPDSLLNGPSSISIASPLRFPRLRQAEPTIDFRLLAKQFFSDCQSLNLVFEEASTGSAAEGEESTKFSMYPKPSNKMETERNNPVQFSTNISESQLPLPPKGGRTSGHDRDFELFKSCNPTQNMTHSINMVKDPNPLKHIQPIGHRDAQPGLSSIDQRVDASKDLRFTESGRLVPGKPSKEFTFDVDDLDIPWNDLVLKEKIGAGSFGTVHRADWHGSDVAVKILMEQEFHAERFKEFLREVAIMKRLRHPNIVLFMGAVTQPPNLSIVTEYLSRGSLYRLLHKPGVREMLDERRRLNMAYDVVCDFGLSRLKANTFLSSKSAAGTPEWMAPEVLRDEPSNEKSDIYSFGVILWELATLQQPWGNLNPAQVVAAVGFKGKRLEIPRNVNPHVASIIEACWANEPWKRPSFSTIMELLRPLIKSPTPQPSPTDMPLLT
ncbi:serine/threonine-protein kinase CTR1 [Citrus sinensis]|uniref:Serine/threonine-protein kinase CTR1 n=2 Tax=Citrus sinensis TaxID=2711 RepID=A0ACB8K070_CITSI|nr:serine/threonine-protein kinase CTR1 [Citrus sinensis]